MRKAQELWTQNGIKLKTANQLAPLPQQLQLKSGQQKIKKKINERAKFRAINKQVSLVPSTMEKKNE